MASLIPNIQVPMNFGLEYLGSPSHGNLKFILKDEVLLANSAIMSLNSPVIKKITIELFQTEILVEEFSKPAIQCFLEASYSGDLTRISKFNFQDLNKMVHVFEVKWLIERCFEYFQGLTESVKEDNFDEQLFLFDQAMYVLEKLKNRRFIDVVIKKFTSLATCTQYFATNYLRDISSCSTKNLDVIVELTADQEHIIVEALVSNLEKNECTLGESSRYMIEKLNYKDCSSVHESVYQRLFKKFEELENPSTEDFRLIMRAMQHYNKALKEMKDSISFAILPNLFHGFQQLNDINDFEELTTFLTESPMVKNSYIFFDALYIWLFEKAVQMKIPFVTISDDFVEKIADIMQNKGWKPVELEYIENKMGPYFGGLTDKIHHNTSLVSDNRVGLKVNCIPSTREYTPEELFARNHDIKFKFKQESITNCTKVGDCGFILRITAATEKLGDSFNIRLVIDPNLYPDDMHFHKELPMLAENIHFTIDVTFEGVTNSARPITWHGRPCRDGTEQFWCWGAERFYKKDEGTMPPTYPLKWASFHGSNRKIRPVVYKLG